MTDNLRQRQPKADSMSYERIPRSPSSQPDDAREPEASPDLDVDPESSTPYAQHTRHLHHTLDVDPRFNPRPPSVWKRLALLVFLILCIWLAFLMRFNMMAGNKKEDGIVYAKRYSKEFKYRPAASPIITERLKDGRIRIRGAGPTAN